MYYDIFFNIAAFFLILTILNFGTTFFRVMMKRIHVNPEEAVKIHQDVRSQRSIGIHWGTFDLAAEVKLWGFYEIEIYRFICYNAR